ncbi:hypothetical protein EMCRGX_G000824 [Ephydatia muelleri]
MEKTCYDDGFTFPIGRPSGGRTLRSVAIVHGVPEIRFDQCDHTPSLTEDEVAAVCRLVSEGKRPQFTFIAIPLGHPFFGRQYKHYDPPWLNGTALGELLFEVDWKMKCLNIGLQTDQAKSVFFSREKFSKTKGLATYLDFDSLGTHGSIFLSSEDVPVELYDDELVFNADPKLSINAGFSPNYSKYISRVLPQIAKYDEPLFTKLQEVLKMLLAAEWLRDKGIEMSEKWMQNATRNAGKKQLATTDNRPCTVECHDLSTNPSCSPPNEYITSLDVSPNEEEAKNCRRVVASSGGIWYGWQDEGGGEMVQFTEGGELCAEIKSERMSITQYVMVDGEKMSTEDWLVNGIRSKTKPEGYSSDMLGGNPDQQEETTVTLDIYQVPKWVWLLSRDGAGIQTVSGGVRTDTLRAVPEKPRDGENSRKKADQYPYTVASRVEGSICSVPEHKRLGVLKIFQDGWKKGPPPIVVTILGIANGALEQKWKWYQSSLTEKKVEPCYFHGTALKCDISSSKTLC